MSLRAILSVGLKLLGLYWLIEAAFRVKDIAICFFFPTEVGTKLSGLNYALNGVDLMLMLTVFVSCSIKTDSVMRFLRVPQDADTEGVFPDSHRLLAAGIAMLGTYFLVMSSVTFIDGLVRAVFIENRLVDVRGRRVTPWWLLLPYAFQLVVSILLIMGSSAFVRWWTALRELPEKMGKRIREEDESPT